MAVPVIQRRSRRRILVHVATNIGRWCLSLATASRHTLALRFQGQPRGDSLRLVIWAIAMDRAGAQARGVETATALVAASGIACVRRRRLRTLPAVDSLSIAGTTGEV